MTIQETIAALEQAHGASTQHPYELEGDWTWEICAGGHTVAKCPRGANHDCHADAAFIVAAHNAFPALLEYVRALERVYDAAEMHLSVYDSPQLKQELELVRALRSSPR